MRQTTRYGKIGIELKKKTVTLEAAWIEIDKTDIQKWTSFIKTLTAQIVCGANKKNCVFVCVCVSKLNYKRLCIDNRLILP